MQNRYQTLITSTRLRESTRQNRSPLYEMLSDKARVLTSSGFRRLQTKAQVFSLETNAAVRSRLTHTLEVSVYGQLIAQKIFDQLLEKGSIGEEYRQAFVTTVENACYLHDLGNPPFGHLGEFAIRSWFDSKSKDVRKTWSMSGVRGARANKHFSAFENFDGNPQGFRIVTRLQWLNDPCGLNLTCTLLASIVKYLTPVPSDQLPFGKKIGYFETERSIVLEIWKRLGLKIERDQPAQRHPLTFIMEAADDIAYSVSDIEDAIEKRIISENEFFDNILEEMPELERFQPNKDEIEGRRVAGNGKFVIFRTKLTTELVDAAAKVYVEHEDEILAGTFDKHLLDVDTNAKKASEALQNLAKKNIYTSHEAVDIELSGFRIVQDILNGFLPLLSLYQFAIEIVH